ncbi:MAG: DUF512 domain-containing protein [Calditrichaeota bacterium]|nr:MAG: DUF512 domain-containing protein [Calditrichota bacterium]
MKIQTIAEKSISEIAGIKIGDKILSINGQEVNDFVDWEYLRNDDFFEIDLLRESQRVSVSIENPDYNDLGIVLEEPQYRTCNNSCVFCFVHQNPSGLRKALYFMDGDYRLSFLYGNFVTLTNTIYSELDRIVEKGMSPVYVSVHATDIDVRSQLLRGRNGEDNILGKIKYLTSNGIDVHTQIVLCPDLNDAKILEKTYTELVELYPSVRTLAVVPVGLTQFRKGLIDVRTVDRNYALQMIKTVAKWQEDCQKNFEENFIFLSDEWFILAGLEVPQSEHYGNFEQVENGVGLVRDFLNKFEAEFETFPTSLETPKQLTFATNTLPQKYIRRVANKLNSIENLNVKVEVVESKFWGKEVTVAGLLTGSDYYEGLKGKDLGDSVILSPDCLSFEGLFLDDWTLPQLEEKLGTKVQRFQGSFRDIIFKNHKLEFTT